MAKKIFILLFVTIFCNGVTYSSPVNGQQIPGAPLPEEKLPTEDHINKKIEPSFFHANTTKTNATNTAVQSATVHPILPSSSGIPPVVSTSGSGNGNGSHDLVLKPTNQAPDDKTIKSLNSTLNSTFKANSSTETGKNESLPVDEKNKMTTKTVAPEKINIDIPAPTQPGETVPSSTSSTLAPPSTTTAATTTAKPTVSTLSPTPVVEHHVPDPVLEKHFDGPSFFGGIVLTVGLTAIGFVAFKYYKSGKIDMNYRSL